MAVRKRPTAIIKAVGLFWIASLNACKLPWTEHTTPVGAVSVITEPAEVGGVEITYTGNGHYWITATARDPKQWGFHKWETPDISTANPLAIAPEKDVELVAHFAQSWNHLVYMAADNDLENYAIRDINEMERAGSGEMANSHRPEMSTTAKIDVA